MPSDTFKQLRFMRAELARVDRGEKSKTGMTREEIADFAHHVKSSKERQSKGMKIRKSMGMSDIEPSEDE